MCLLKLALLGYGKMGQTVEQAATRAGIEVACIIDPLSGSRGEPADCDVCIDFSEPGEVTFNYLTSSLAKIYRAPHSMVGKVFTIYFKPGQPSSKDELRLSPGVRRCVEQMTTSTYYMVNDAGVAYQFHHGTDQLETVIYQPSRAQVRSLAVNTECVF